MPYQRIITRLRLVIGDPGSFFASSGSEDIGDTGSTYLITIAFLSLVPAAMIALITWSLSFSFGMEPPIALMIIRFLSAYLATVLMATALLMLTAGALHILMMLLRKEYSFADSFRIAAYPLLIFIMGAVLFVFPISLLTSSASSRIPLVGLWLFAAIAGFIASEGIRTRLGFTREIAILITIVLMLLLAIVLIAGLPFIASMLF